MKEPWEARGSHLNTRSASWRNARQDSEQAFVKKACRGCNPGKPLIDLKMEDVDHYVGFTVEEHDVPTDEHVCAIGRRWRQTMLQLFGAGVQTLLQTRRQCAADDQ